MTKNSHTHFSPRSDMYVDSLTQRLKPLSVTPLGQFLFRSQPFLDLSQNSRHSVEPNGWPGFTTAQHWSMFLARYIQSKLSHPVFNNPLFEWYPAVYAQAFHAVSVLLVCPPKPCMQFSPLPCSQMPIPSHPWFIHSYLIGWGVKS